MSTRPFLLEIGTEEIPAGYIAPYCAQLSRDFSKALTGYNVECGKIHVDGTPRRLVLFCESIQEKQPEETIEMKGPPAAIAFADGTPTKAAEGFCRKNDISLDTAEVKEIDGKEYLVATVTRGGADTTELLKEILPALVRGLKSPKSMRWGSHPTVFARPIQWLLALYGDEVIPAVLDDITASGVTYGHRFLAPDAIEIKSADYSNYTAALKDASVIVDTDERITRITESICSNGGQRDKIDHSLVRTCAYLVEWPTVVRGTFDDEYAELPEPVLTTSLKTHQKSFLLHEDDGRVIPAFLSVTNNDLEDEASIRSGYERVITARLADAAFFWNEDRKKSMNDRVDSLKEMVFQEELGSYFDKTERVVSLTKTMCEKAGLPDVAEAAGRAAYLSRADLTTAMVFEFPELQGTMGRIYAGKIDGEEETVCAAIEEMYFPRGADDPVPSTRAGAVVSIADKLDTLCGCCAVGFAPTGSADPYALRRQTLGILRTLIQHEIHVSLKELVQAACAQISSAANDSVCETVQSVIDGRMETVLKDIGVPYDVINAVCAADTDDVTEIAQRAQQLTALHDTEEMSAACTVVERSFNITKDTEISEIEVNPSLFSEELEKEVWKIWETTIATVRECMSKGDTAGAIKVLGGEYAEKLHEYFEEVRVNVEEADVRKNRLAMLRGIYKTIAKEFADLSAIVFSSTHGTP